MSTTPIGAPPVSLADPLGQPLRGLRVLEFQGIGPGPLAGRILAGMGASVTLVQRPGDRQAGIPPGNVNPLLAGKSVLTLDLKNPEDVARALALVETHDALIEGLRPGVMERLGLGPAACAATPNWCMAA